MNTSRHNIVRSARILAATLVSSTILASCATAPQMPAGAADARTKLNGLEANSTLADRVPVEIREAKAAVQIAEQPVGKDIALGNHRVYMAERKVDIAVAKASTRYAEDERGALSQARDEARLNARTREADNARRQAEAAQSATKTAQSAAESARESAAVAASDATAKAENLQKQIDELQAEATDRGLVLTLGNVLFATGKSELKSGGVSSLDKLVKFLDEYPDRGVAIEGHTDDVGSADLNQKLSQSRAESVKSYLMQHGVRSQRMTAQGMGESRPAADNDSESGRQQNRRVEIVIENPPPAVPTASTN